MSNETNRVKLLGITDPFRGKEFYITSDEFTVGRSNDSDLLLAENTISAGHAKVVKNGDTYELYDLNSTNGTYINNERISRKALRSDDILKFDVYEFRFINAGDVARTVLADSPDFEKVDSANGDTKESPLVQAASVKQKKPKRKKKAVFEKKGSMVIGVVIAVLLALALFIGSAFGSSIIDSGMPYDIMQTIQLLFIMMPLAHTHFTWLAPSLMWTIGSGVLLAGTIVAGILGGWITKAITRKNVVVSSFSFALFYVLFAVIAQVILVRFDFSKIFNLYSNIAPFGFYESYIAAPIVIAYFFGTAFVLAFIGGLFKRN